jgi:hypothetical protein
MREEEIVETNNLSQACSLSIGISIKNNIRDINIIQLNYGYIVKVGCNSFAIETPERLIEKLTEYIKEPQATEKKWNETKLL